MRLSLGNSRSLLVIAPHPDDETIGAFGLMTRLRRQGVQVRVLVVTDGGASHAGSPTWSRRRLIRERQRETRRAVRRAGVTAGNIRFLEFRDGGSPDRETSIRRAVAAAIRRARRPALVAGPAIDDDHPDHRTAAAAVLAARTGGVRSIAYPVWPAGRRAPRSRLLFLTAQQRLAKRSAILSYRTQTGRITDDPAGFAMTRAQVAAFSRQTETFMVSRS